MRRCGPLFTEAGALATACILVLCAACGSAPVTTTSFWLQTMDSCKQAIGGASYELIGTGVHILVNTPAQPVKATIRSHRLDVCPPPVQQGDCSESIPTGCVQFKNVPYPGVYHIRQIKTPPPNKTNSLGYAPCQGGSACRLQTAEVTISSTGVVQATVININPDGVVETWPLAREHQERTAYAGTRDDPVVTHDFGMATGNYRLDCDRDRDADDWGTGGQREHCGYPESEETSACQPYPWSCTMPAAERNAPTPSGVPTAPRSSASPRATPP
jgi:hypothetical protein